MRNILNLAGPATVKIHLALITLLMAAGSANADNILLPISGVWVAREGPTVMVLKISNGQQVLPGGFIRGQCRIEIRDGAGFVINQADGIYTFRAHGFTRGQLRLDLPGGSVDLQEHEFGTNNSFMRIQFGTMQSVFRKVH